MIGVHIWKSKFGFIAALKVNKRCSFLKYAIMYRRREVRKLHHCDHK